MDRPLILVTVAYVTGIIFARLIALPVWFGLLALLLFLLLTLLAYCQKLNLSYFILILCFLLGFFSCQIRNLPAQNDISLYADKGYLTLIGHIDNAPKIKEGTTSFPLKVERVALDGVSKEVGGNVYVLLRQENLCLSYGDKISARGILLPFQEYANPLMLQPRKAYSLNATFIDKIKSNGGNIFKHWALGFSQKFNEVLIKILPQKEASLLGSVLLGSSVSPLSDELKNNYRKAGLIHLLVVSGTQVSILIGVCLSIFKTFNFPLPVSVAVASFFNLMLVIVTGGGASILRAAIMGEIMLIGLLFDRRKEFYTTLCISALVLLVVNPLTLFDIGFQLSFAATWALVYIAPVLEKKLPSLLAISLAPILATSPIILFYFSQVSPGALVSNLLVLPWVEFLVILGFSTTVLGFVFLPLARILGNTIWLLLFLLEKISNTVASLPFACFYIKAPSIISIIGYYCLLIGAIEIFKKEGKIILNRKRMLFVFIFCLSIFIWDKSFSAIGFSGKELTVTFLDVGQGDAILIEAPDGKKILIDGGGVESGKSIRVSGNQKEKIRGAEKQAAEDAIGEKVVVPFLHRKGINRLDMMILTHPHADHLGGLNSVLKEIKVDQVLDSGQAYASQAYQRFKGLIRRNKIKYSVAFAGQKIEFGEGLTGDILNPGYPLLGSTNSDSIVMRLVYGEISFLLTGDVEGEGEERILRSALKPLPSTVLKVGHHGSRTSTSDEFLEAVNPLYAVISVGRHNRYRHPSKITLQRLTMAGTKVYRTDESGAIVIKTDGEKLKIDCQK